MTPAVTRAAAYAELRPTLGRRQAEVLSLVRLNPGRTALELARIAKWGDPNRLRPRLVELAHAGYVEPAGSRECAVSGKAAMTWRLAGPVAQGELFAQGGTND